MDDLDFLGSAETPPVDLPKRKIEADPLYVPKLALDFFRIAGSLEQFPQGACIFAEKDKPGRLFSTGAKMYLLLNGGVTLMLNGKPLDLVMPGEIFGEMTVISDRPRSATATAWKASKVLSLDEDRFQFSLEKKPEFALMLISLLAQRLRRCVSKLAGKPNVAKASVHRDTLDRGLLAELREELGDPMTTSAHPGENVISKGAAGLFMYVVLDGRIAIEVNGQIVEYVEHGGVFGEMALIDRTERAATATAVTECTWFTVSRDQLIDVVKNSPALGMALLKSMCERVQHMDDLIVQCA